MKFTILKMAQIYLIIKRKNGELNVGLVLVGGERRRYEERRDQRRWDGGGRRRRGFDRQRHLLASVRVMMSA